MRELDLEAVKRIHAAGGDTHFVLLEEAERLRVELGQTRYDRDANKDKAIHWQERALVAEDKIQAARDEAGRIYEIPLQEALARAERALWRDIDKTLDSNLHMNWGDCSCSSCSRRRVVAALVEARDRIAAALDRGCTDRGCRCCTSKNRALTGGEK